MCVLPDGRKWKDTSRVQSVRAMSEKYNQALKSFGLRDYQVAHVMMHVGRGTALCKLVYRSLVLSAFLICWLPMTLVWAPLIATT